MRWPIALVLGAALASGLMLAPSGAPAEEVVTGTAAAGDLLLVRQGDIEWMAKVAGPDPIHDASGAMRATTRIQWTGPEEVHWWVDEAGQIVAEGLVAAGQARYPDDPMLADMRAPLDMHSRSQVLANGTACLWQSFGAWMIGDECKLVPGASMQPGLEEAYVRDGVARAQGPQDALEWPSAAPYPSMLRTGLERWQIEVVERGQWAAWGNVAGTAPELRLAAAEPWGLPEIAASGVFLPREAYDAAAASPTWSAFREWVGKHPDHALVNRTWWRMYTVDHQEMAWTMTFVSSSDAFSMRVTKSVPATMLATLPPQVSTAATYTFEQLPLPAGELPGLGALPTQWPTHASVVDRWHAVSGDVFARLDPSAITYAWRCSDVCGPTDLRLVAHYWDGTYSPISGAQGQWASDWAYSAVVMDGTGRLTSLAEWTEEARTLERPLPTPTQDLPPEPATGQRVWTVTGAAAAGAAAALLVWILAGLRHAAWFPLFSRIRDDDLLDHPARQAIMDGVQGEPGIRVEELRRRAGLSNGSMHHHIMRLVRGRHLQTRQVGRATHLFPARTDAKLAEALPLAREGSRRAVMHRLERGPATPRALHGWLGISRSTVYEHVARLEEAGLVRRGNGNIELTRLRQQVAAQLIDENPRA